MKRAATAPRVLALSLCAALASMLVAPRARADAPPPPGYATPPSAQPAQAAPPSAPAAAPDDEDDDRHAQKKSKSKGRFLVKVAAGGAYRRIFSVPIYAGELQLSLGGGTDKIAFFFDMTGMLGRTEYHLQTGQFDLGGSIEGNFSPVHLGFNLHLSYMYIARTTSSATMDSLGVGVAPFFLVDVLPFDDNALYLGIRVPLDLSNGAPAPGVWGVTGMLGIRF